MERPRGGPTSANGPRTGSLVTQDRMGLAAGPDGTVVAAARPCRTVGPSAAVQRSSSSGTLAPRINAVVLLPTRKRRTAE